MSLRLRRTDLGAGRGAGGAAFQKFLNLAGADGLAFGMNFLFEILISY